MTTAISSDARPSWTNWAKNQVVRPEQLLMPRSLAELQQIVREVSARGGRMKAVATGLSFSDILQTDDTLVLVTEVKSAEAPGVLLPLEQELLRDPNDPEIRVRVVCGARIRELNATLVKAGLGFTNLGGFDGQTLVGAISTSTHGSGLRLPPFCDLVRSIDLVATGGVLFRVEPSRGITDPDKFRRRYGTSMTLVQNDDWFYSTVVSLGCMGVVHSMTVAVSPAYRLVETRRVANWSNVRKRLLAGANRFRNYEVWINPHARPNGEHTCLVTQRRFAPIGADPLPLPGIRHWFENLLFTKQGQETLLTLMRRNPRLIPSFLDASLAGLENARLARVEDSYKIYNIGQANYAEVLSGEYFMPLTGDTHVRAVDRLIQVARSERARGRYQSGPFALRVMRGSRHYLSMAYGRDSFSIEIPAYRGLSGAAEMLLEYERALYEFGSRPHWGQMHELTGERGFLCGAYPMARRFLDVYRNLNAGGTFNNHFTDRLRISMPDGGCS